jgi:hypothetical protein
MTKLIIGKLFVFGVIFLINTAVAQELSPRAYWPAPEGTRVATVGYTYTKGDAVPDRSLPITGVDSSIRSMHFGFRQTLNLWDRTANLIIELPYTEGSTEGEHLERGLIKTDYQGAGDLAATLSVNLLGAPAMTRQEFRALRSNPNSILGVSVKLVAPTGKYDSDRLINVGANRWAMKAELGYIMPLSQKWLLEVAAGAWFFADNDNFLGVTKKQRPVAAIQGHLIHRFRPGLWASLDMNYYKGGRSTIGGIELNDLQRDSKVGATLVFPFAKKYAIKLGYTKGSLNDSDEEFDAFLASYQQLF